MQKDPGGRSNRAAAARLPWRVASALLAALLASTLLACGAPWTQEALTGEADSGSGADALTTSGSPDSSQPCWWWDALPQDDRALMSIAAYTGEPAVQLNGNSPVFDAQDGQAGAFESFSDLDSLGRCGVAYACLGPELLSTEERGDISQVHPSGWDGTTYGFVDQGKVFNRSHLIAHSLSGQDANEKNLITGTRYFNATTMQIYEAQVLEYIRSTGNHVLYRVTPVFEGDNLVASGVQMEALSVEDTGSSLAFNVFCYNVQPGVVIDYSNGQNWVAQVYGGETDASGQAARSSEGTREYVQSTAAVSSQAGSGQAASANQDAASPAAGAAESTQVSYVANTNSMKFHLPSCEAVSSIASANRMDFTGAREELISAGYTPCGTCNP